MEVKFWANETMPDREKKVTYLLMDLIEYAIENGCFLMAEDKLTASYIVNEHAKNGALALVNLDDILKLVREEKYDCLRVNKEKNHNIAYKVHISKEFMNSEKFECWMKTGFHGTGLESDWKEDITYEGKEVSMTVVSDERCSMVDRIQEIKGKPYTDLNLDSVRVFQKIGSSGRYHETSKELEMRDIVDLILANYKLGESGCGIGPCVLESIYQYYEIWLRLFR